MLATGGRVRRGRDGGIAGRRGNRAEVYAYAASRNALPTSDSYISWTHTTSRSRHSPSTLRSGSSSFLFRNGAATRVCRQAKVACRRANRCLCPAIERRAGSQGLCHCEGLACSPLCQTAREKPIARSAWEFRYPGYGTAFGALRREGSRASAGGQQIHSAGAEAPLILLVHCGPCVAQAG